MNPTTLTTNPEPVLQNIAKQEVMNTNPPCKPNDNNDETPDRKIGRNYLKVTIIKGPASKGGRGAWKFAVCGKTSIPIYKNSNKDKPLYQVPCSTAEGKSTKKSFRVEQEAIDEASKLAQLPPKAAATFSSIPRHLLAAIVMALQMLETILAPLKISITAALEEYAGAKQLVGHKDLRDIVKAYCAEPWVKKSKTPARVVMETFLAGRKKANHRKAYLDSLFYPLRRLADHVGETAIGDITKAQLEAVIMAGGTVARSHKTYWTGLRTFFKWCKLQEYLNPTRPTVAEQLDRIHVDKHSPQVYTVAEARAMLTQTRDVPSVLLLVFGFFTGLRHAELLRIDWEHIQFGGKIVVEPRVGKLRDRRRTIPMLPVLLSWLEPFKGYKGLVLPYLTKRDLLSAYLKGLGMVWRRNGLRQSFASYRLAFTGDILQTAEEDGHSGYILETVYRDKVTREAAQEYFQLTPDACGQTDWAERVRQYIQDNPPRNEHRKRKSPGRRPIVPVPQPQPGTSELPANVTPLTNADGQIAA